MIFAGKIDTVRNGSAFDPGIGLFTIGLQPLIKTTWNRSYCYGYYSLRTMMGIEIPS